MIAAFDVQSRFLSPSIFPTQNPVRFTPSVGSTPTSGTKLFNDSGPSATRRHRGRDPPGRAFGVLGLSSALRDPV